MGETQIRPLTGADFEAVVALDARITGPTASLDTIGVDPGFSGKGYARALLTQMIENLAAIHVERLETEVAAGDLALRRFLHAFGFRPAQRLPFERAF
jgi:ribosomal protein S18 acetylase RimI-like enzyme